MGSLDWNASTAASFTALAPLDIATPLAPVLFSGRFAATPLFLGAGTSPTTDTFSCSFASTSFFLLFTVGVTVGPFGYTTSASLPPATSAAAAAAVSDVSPAAAWAFRAGPPETGSSAARQCVKEDALSSRAASRPLRRGSGDRAEGGPPAAAAAGADPA